MRPTAIALTLLAAMLHATWNAVLRSSLDRLWSVTIMSFATTLAAVPFALLLPLPLTQSWTYLGFSAVLQVAYIILLAHAYRSGELAQVYPVVRGSVPLLVTIGGFVLAGQRVGPAGLLGIALISLGIVSLALGRVRAEAKTLALGLLTALLVASYVTADGIGVRLSGNPQSYAAWIFLIYGALLPATFLLLRGRITVKLRAPETVKALTGGFISLASYGAIIAALAVSKLGPVSALRETSIVFAALIGHVVLGERLTGRRMLVCLAVTLGAVCIAFAA
ncbi:MAG TPA: DMT family transporter [Steroidobacteraceae bacterium]|nr:DMT family transporter [Steroidobacteraceae bacterium]